MTLVNCKTYPPSVEENCVWECVDYLTVTRGLDHTPQPELERRCRDGVPDFCCESKMFYDGYFSDDSNPKSLDVFCSPP